MFFIDAKHSNVNVYGYIYQGQSSFTSTCPKIIRRKLLYSAPLLLSNSEAIEFTIPSITSVRKGLYELYVERAASASIRVVMLGKMPNDCMHTRLS